MAGNEDSQSVKTQSRKNLVNRKISYIMKKNHVNSVRREKINGVVQYKNLPIFYGKPECIPSTGIH